MRPDTTSHRSLAAQRSSAPITAAPPPVTPVGFVTSCSLAVAAPTHSHTAAQKNLDPQRPSTPAARPPQRSPSKQFKAPAAPPSQLCRGLVVHQFTTPCNCSTATYPRHCSQVEISQRCPHCTDSHTPPIRSNPAGSGDPPRSHPATATRPHSSSAAVARTRTRSDPQRPPWLLTTSSAAPATHTLPRSGFPEETPNNAPNKQPYGGPATLDPQPQLFRIMSPKRRLLTSPPSGGTQSSPNRPNCSGLLVIHPRSNPVRPRTVPPLPTSACHDPHSLSSGCGHQLAR
jgi:hypothetical protein